MRTLTLPRARAWLAERDLFLDAYERLEWPYDAHPGLYVISSNVSKNWPEICRESLDWLPVGRERILLATRWETYPPDRLIVFDAIRRGAGASESLTSEPAHLFTSTKPSDTGYEDRGEVDVYEESVAMWLTALMVQWQWWGYAAVDGCSDVIGLGDGFIHFLSIDSRRMEQAREMAESWQLSTATRFPWVGAAVPVESRH